MVKTGINNPDKGDKLVASEPSGTISTMDKKAEKSLLGYNLYRDGVIIAEEIQETTFQDMDLTAGVYTYDVKAVYDEGLSLGAGPVEITILGGVDRELVIIEVATGTWCQYCPGAAMGVDEMHEEGLSVGIIEYHSGDDYETTESAARLAYYNVAGYPTAVFDGVDESVGGNATQSLYADYLPRYETRIGVPSLFTIEAEYYNVSGTSYQVSIDAEMINTYPGLDNDIVLQVALTESHIPEAWQNQSELNFVCRDLIPDDNGTALDFASSATQTVTLDFTIPSNYVMSNLEIIVFIQDNNTREVLQASEAVYWNGVEDQLTSETQVYPNPASDIVNIVSDYNIESITVYNFAGQIVHTESVNNTSYHVNTSEFKLGVYLFLIETQKGRIAKRIVIK